MEQIAQWEDERRRCPSCGEHPEVCGNPETIWYPQREICWKTVAQEAAARRYHLKHKERPFHDGTFAGAFAKEPSAGDPLRPSKLIHYMDGVSIYVTTEDLTPDDDWI